MDHETLRQEIAAYDNIASSRLREDAGQSIHSLIGDELYARFRRSGTVEGFPSPPSVWVDSVANSLSQWCAYRWLSPISGSKFLQLGGSGSHAIKAIMGGAEHSWLLTPATQEGFVAKRIAERIGVDGRLSIASGVGELLPFRDCSFDRVFGGGTLHHMELESALRELCRVLKPGGRAAFVEPRLNFIYKFLRYSRITNLVREPGAQCQPLDAEDVLTSATRVRTIECLRRGGPVRYLIVGLTRLFGIKVPVRLSLTLQAIETELLLRCRLGGLLGGLAIVIEK